MNTLLIVQAMMLLVMATHVMHVMENEFWPTGWPEEDTEDQDDVPLNPDGTLPEDE